MPRLYSLCNVNYVITEIGESSSDDSGYGSVTFSSEQLPSVNVVVSPNEDSYNAFVITRNAFGFTFGTSVPNKKITFKVMSVRA